LATLFSFFSSKLYFEPGEFIFVAAPGTAEFQKDGVSP
jgi:hypothetical protein